MTDLFPFLLAFFFGLNVFLVTMWVTYMLKWWDW